MCASGCLGSGGDEIIILPASRRNLLPDFLDLCFCLSRRALLHSRAKKSNLIVSLPASLEKRLKEFLAQFLLYFQSPSRRSARNLELKTSSHPRPERIIATAESLECADVDDSDAPSGASRNPCALLPD